MCEELGVGDRLAADVRVPEHETELSARLKYTAHFAQEEGSI
jgi:hypothetical protein